MVVLAWAGLSADPKRPRPVLAQGLTPLLAALTASSPGVSVVNIDNGARPPPRLLANPTPRSRALCAGYVREGVFALCKCCAGRFV